MSSNNTTAPSMMNATPAKATKRVSKKTEETVAPVAAPAPAPVEAKETKKRAAKKEAAAPAPAPAAAPAPVVAATESTEEVTWQQELKAAHDQLTAVRDAASAALKALSRLEKRVGRELKEARKSKRKARKELAEGEVRAPSEFEKPRPISDELSSFLGLGKGAQMSRGDVTKAISAYVKSNGLGNGQKINPNAALRKLLGVSETEELTIFNMQRYLNRHYLKPATA